MKFAPSRSLFLATTTVLTVAVSPCVHAADRWWDGGTANIVPNGDGLSTSVSGTWSSTISNWDQGSGLAHVAWDNGGNDTAIFGQIASGTTITLGTDVSVNSLRNISTASTYSFSGAGRTLTLSGTVPSIYAGGTTQINTAIAGSSGLIKNGPGSLAIQSSASNSGFTGGLTVNQGIMELSFGNFSATGNLSDVIDPSNTLTLNNSNAQFRLRAKVAAGTTNTQTLGAVTVNGAGQINVNGGTSTTTTLNLGAISRNPGATLGFSYTTSGTNVATVPAGTVLGNWAIVSNSGLGAASAFNYATVNGSNQVVALAGTAAADAAALTDTTGAVNYDLTLATGTMGSPVSANSIRYIGTVAGTTALGTSSFTVNSLANSSMTNGAKWTISGGNLNIGSSNELILHTGDKGIQIDSKIQGAAGACVTIDSVINGTTGGASIVTLGGANTYTGTTTVNGNNAYVSNGHLVITTLGDTASNIGAGGPLILNGASIKVTPGTTNNSTARSITLNGNTGLYNAGSANNATFSGNISGSGTLNIDQNNNVAGGIVLSGDNSYSGEIQFQTDGRLIVAGAKSLKNATLNASGQRIFPTFSGNLAFEVGSLKGGSVALDFGALNTSNVTIGGNGQSNIFTAPLNGAVGLIKKGSETQTLVTAGYTGGTVIEGGTLKLQSMQGLPSTTLTINAADANYSNKQYLTVTPAQAAALAVGQTMTVNGAADEILHIDYTGKLYLKNATGLTGTPTVVINPLKGSISSSTIEVKPGAFLDVSAVSGFTLASNQTIQGKGTVIGDMTVAGTLSPGSSPGTLTTGSEIWSNGGDYNWQVQDAAGSAGSGYDTIAVNGTLDLSALTTGGFSLNLWTLAGLSPDANGEAINFNNASDYAWTILSTTGGLINFDAADFSLNTGAGNGTSGFSNGLAGGAFSLTTSGDNKDLILKFNAAAAVPEPSSMILGGLGALALFRRRRS